VQSRSIFAKRRAKKRCKKFQQSISAHPINWVRHDLHHRVLLLTLSIQLYESKFLFQPIFYIRAQKCQKHVILQVFVKRTTFTFFEKIWKNCISTLVSANESTPVLFDVAFHTANDRLWLVCPRLPVFPLNWRVWRWHTTATWWPWRRGAGNAQFSVNFDRQYLRTRTSYQLAIWTVKNFVSVWTLSYIMQNFTSNVNKTKQSV